jgi:predicted RNase H-like HicB family nuclease
MNDEQKIENEIQQKGLTAPRITPAYIDATIASEHYFTAAEGAYGKGDWAKGKRGPFGEPGRQPDVLDRLTFCVLVLRNGFTVTGESACVSPENFDPATGRKIAREHARNKIWQLEGYALRQRLFEASPLRTSVLRYPARIEPDGVGFLVTFRDIPEANSSGFTLDEARTMAADALLSAMEIYFEDNRKVPLPSEAQKGEYLIALPQEVSSKVLIFNASLLANS